MLVQLSEWQKTPTSLRIQKNKKKKVTNGQSSPSSPATLLSFVNNNRGANHLSKRRKGGASKDEEPCIVLTSSHQISVVNSTSSVKALQESERMQYSCRPGSQSSFLHEPYGIPALLSGDRFYAVQNKNTTVTSWGSQSLGPDDDNAARLALEEPLLCLHHHLSFVYGTLQNSASLFVGVLKKNNQTVMQKFVFDLPKGLKQLRHVCTTILEVPSSNDDDYEMNYIGTKRKRKQQQQRSTQAFRLVQVFLDQGSIVLVQHMLQMNHHKNEPTVERDDSATKAAEIPLPPHTSIDSISFKIYKNSVALMMEEESKIGSMEVVAKKKKKKQKNGVIIKKSLQGVINPPKKSFVCCLSIEDGILLGSFDAPCHSRLIGFVCSNVLAITNDQSSHMELYEIQHGISIQKILLNGSIVDSSISLSSTANGEQRLILKSSSGKTVEISSAILERSMEIGDEVRHEVIGLADSLKCCMEIDTQSTIDDEPKDLMLLLEQSESADTNILDNVANSAVQQALASLEACSNRILDPIEEKLDSQFFLDAYEDALSILSQSNATTKLMNGVTPENKKNKRNTFTNEKLLDRGHTPNTTPQSFVDGALRLVLKILLLPFDENRKKHQQIKLNAARLDARLLLYRLIQSKKVLARQHFGFEDSETMTLDSCRLWRVLKATKLTKKGYQRHVSPVDVIHAMLSNCSDLTEHHLLTMIHYSMVKTLPEDVANDVMDRRFIFKDSSPARKYSISYFRIRSSLYKLQKANKPPNGSKTMKEVENELDNLSSKLWYEGLCFVVQRVLSYTPVVNETLLRLALSSIWYNPKSTAPKTLVGILKQVWEREHEHIILHAGESSQENYHGWSNSSSVMMNALKWTLVILETIGCSSDLAGIQSKMSMSLKHYIKSTQHMVTLQPLLQRSCKKLPKKTRTPRQKLPPSSSEQSIPSSKLIAPPKAGYSIETLILY